MLSGFTRWNNDHGHVREGLSLFDTFHLTINKITTETIINQIDYIYDDIAIIYDLNTA